MPTESYLLLIKIYIIFEIVLMPLEPKCLWVPIFRYCHLKYKLRQELYLKNQVIIKNYI
jgi:hypothetical protein